MSACVRKYRRIKLSMAVAFIIYSLLLMCLSANGATVGDVKKQLARHLQSSASYEKQGARGSTDVVARLSPSQGRSGNISSKPFSRPRDQCSDICKDGGVLRRLKADVVRYRSFQDYLDRYIFDRLEFLNKDSLADFRYCVHGSLALHIRAAERYFNGDVQAWLTESGLSRHGDIDLLVSNMSGANIIAQDIMENVPVAEIRKQFGFDLTTDSLMSCQLEQLIEGEPVSGMLVWFIAKGCHNRKEHTVYKIDISLRPKNEFFQAEFQLQSVDDKKTYTLPVISWQSLNSELEVDLRDGGMKSLLRLKSIVNHEQLQPDLSEVDSFPVNLLQLLKRRGEQSTGESLRHKLEELENGRDPWPLIEFEKTKPKNVSPPTVSERPTKTVKPSVLSSTASMPLKPAQYSDINYIGQINAASAPSVLSVKLPAKPLVSTQSPLTQKRTFETAGKNETVEATPMAKNDRRIPVADRVLQDGLRLSQMIPEQSSQYVRQRLVAAIWTTIAGSVRRWGDIKLSQKLSEKIRALVRLQPGAKNFWQQLADSVDDILVSRFQRQARTRQPLPEMVSIAKSLMWMLSLKGKSWLYQSSYNYQGKDFVMTSDGVTLLPFDIQHQWHWLDELELELTKVASKIDAMPEAMYADKFQSRSNGCHKIPYSRMIRLAAAILSNTCHSKIPVILAPLLDDTKAFMIMQGRVIKRGRVERLLNHFSEANLVVIKPDGHYLYTHICSNCSEAGDLEASESETSDLETSDLETSEPETSVENSPIPDSPEPIANIALDESLTVNDKRKKPQLSALSLGTLHSDSLPVDDSSKVSSVISMISDQPNDLEVETIHSDMKQRSSDEILMLDTSVYTTYDEVDHTPFPLQVEDESTDFQNTIYLGEYKKGPWSFSPSTTLLYSKIGHPRYVTDPHRLSLFVKSTPGSQCSDSDRIDSKGNEPETRINDVIGVSDTQASDAVSNLLVTLMDNLRIKDDNDELYHDSVKNIQLDRLMQAFQLDSKARPMLIKSIDVSGTDLKSDRFHFLPSNPVLLPAQLLCLWPDLNFEDSLVHSLQSLASELSAESLWLLAVRFFQISTELKQRDIILMLPAGDEPDDIMQQTIPLLQFHMTGHVTAHHKGDDRDLYDFETAEVWQLLSDGSLLLREYSAFREEFLQVTSFTPLSSSDDTQASVSDIFEDAKTDLSDFSSNDGYATPTGPD